eukprot:9487590-Pyramimonas_sp.AAC.2
MAVMMTSMMSVLMAMKMMMLTTMRGRRRGKKRKERNRVPDAGSKRAGNRRYIPAQASKPLGLMQKTGRLHVAKAAQVDSGRPCRRALQGLLVRDDLEVVQGAFVENVVLLREGRPPHLLGLQGSRTIGLYGISGLFGYRAKGCRAIGL